MYGPKNRTVIIIIIIIIIITFHVDNFIAVFVQSILIQIRSTIMSDSQAQLDRDADHAYTEREARDAFTRMVAKYGWNK